jgi:two-component system, OmpR family, sensor histidine kinase BaeS
VTDGRPEDSRPRERPGWWPDDEPWPPEEWRGPPWWGRHGGRGPGGPWGRSGAWGPPWRRRGMARRFGCFVVLLSVVFVSIGVIVLWLIGNLLGVVGGESGLFHLARAAGLVVLVVGGVAIVFGIRLARNVGPPLGDLIEAAGRVEAGDYAARVPEVVRGPRELRDLARAFNTMTTRLELDEAQRRRLLADVSHELRTPLAVIQGNLEAIVDGVYPADEEHLGAILDETRVLSRLIEDLRTLSLAEAGTLTLHREPTDLAVLVADVARSFGPRADAAGVTLAGDVPDDLPLLDVDPIRIREVLANLVANALRYVPPGGTVRLSGRDASDAVELEVVDDGPGIPPELLPIVFDRFAKSADSRGSGLGLAIARAIVEAHGGRIAADSQPSTGTTIRVVLPAEGPG